MSRPKDSFLHNRESRIPYTDLYTIRPEGNPMNPMDRRTFLQTAAATAAAAGTPAAFAQSASSSHGATSPAPGALPAAKADTSGHTLVCTFTRNGETWKVYEDLRTRDGAFTFVSTHGMARVLPKSAEATFASDGSQHLGLDIKDIGMSGPDLLADKLLANGDPNEDDVRAAAPPMNSAQPRTPNPNYRPNWNTFVGT